MVLNYVSFLLFKNHFFFFSFLLGVIFFISFLFVLLCKHTLKRTLDDAAAAVFHFRVGLRYFKHWCCAVAVCSLCSLAVIPCQRAEFLFVSGEVKQKTNTEIYWCCFNSLEWTFTEYNTWKIVYKQQQQQQ